MRAGHVHVGVSAQQVGANALKTFDPVRYAPINHPGDSAANAIFAQAGPAGPRRADRHLYEVQQPQERNRHHLFVRVRSERNRRPVHAGAALAALSNARRLRAEVYAGRRQGGGRRLHGAIGSRHCGRQGEERTDSEVNARLSNLSERKTCPSATGIDDVDFASTLSALGCLLVRREHAKHVLAQDLSDVNQAEAPAR